MGNIFLIKYKLKRKNNNFQINPPPPKLQSIYFLFPTPVSVSLAAGGHSGSHISHRLVGEVGEKNSDHSIFPYAVDGYTCDSVLLVWQPLVWQGDHCKRTTDLNNTHHLNILYCGLTVKQNAQDDHSLAITGIVWKTTTSSSPLFSLFFWREGRDWGRQTNHWQDADTHTLLGNRKSCFFFLNRLKKEKF